MRFPISSNAIGSWGRRGESFQGRAEQHRIDADTPVRLNSEVMFLRNGVIRRFLSCRLTHGLLRTALSLNQYLIRRMNIRRRFLLSL
jgi:hypothetical protein